MLRPINLTDGTVAEIIFLDPARPHTQPDERGCPDCEQDAYFSGCDAPGCNGWGCPDCGAGCDLDFVDADGGGRCAAYAKDDDFQDDDED
ncbi:hypothetical protein ADL27_26245 [Streptomyces sp. NRRL F-6602]|nr:hypothetical protein ADL27_26245 [Streptomyces sp. NRRL F-6602]